MFTGIIEHQGQFKKKEQAGSNYHLNIASALAPELKVDQSVAHDGVCLTVTAVEDDSYWVTAIEETLKKTNLVERQVGDVINLERSATMGGRIDGHIVQGHVDSTGICQSIEDQEGSWVVQVEYPEEFRPLLVEKGSICLNGISLTVFDCDQNYFKVAIIPFTFEHTNMQFMKPGMRVNLEFDIIGKYVARSMEAHGPGAE